MKRSDMVRKMALHIARQSVHAGKVDLDLSWLNTDDLLGLMEEVGMLPPAEHGYNWEPEDD